MCEKKISSKSIYFGYLALLSFIVLLLTCFTPLIVDDWYENVVFGTDRTITSIGDFMESRWNHYHGQNGRVFAESIVNLFGAVLGKGLYSICNSLVFVWFLHLLVSAFIDTKYRLKAVIIAGFTILCVFPGFVDTFLWMSGSIGYLWSATFLLVFWRIYSNTNAMPGWSYILLLVYGMACGMGNEAVVLPSAFAIGLYSLSWIKELRLKHYMMFLGLVIGILVWITCPATMRRVDSSIQEPLLSVFISTIRIMPTHDRILLLLLMILGIGSFRNWEYTKRFLRKNSILIATLAFSFLIILYSRNMTERCKFGTNMLSLVLIIRYIDFPRVKSSVALVLAAATVILISASLPYSYANYHEFRRVDKALTQTDECIIGTHEVHPPFFAQRFVTGFVPSENNGYDCSYDRNNYINKYIARYYHKPFTAFIPDNILSDIRTGNVGKTFIQKEEYAYYVRKWEHSAPIRGIEFLLRPCQTGDIPFYLLPVASHMQKYSATKVSAGLYSVVEIDGSDYLFVDKNVNVSNRVEDIVVR